MSCEKYSINNKYIYTTFDLNSLYFSLIFSVNKFNFLIDGRAKKKIRQFIEKQPKFEDICLELQSYNKFVEQTQEISSLEYFTFIR